MADAISEGYINAVEQCRERILHALEIYPFLSASMIHQAIGTATSTALWRPILQEMVEDGRVTEESRVERSPLGRLQSYTIYSLHRNSYQKYVDNGKI